ncbi:hypothetical protein [Bacillus sp. 1NLA3E]|uniref:hypothetical protein n=1 Tax=Bacillus sp. 1NLA3E TaxID=666686 RepID=UPI000247EB0C|nr:hypothetical protein [Bacillus sp. 1NLA3E]AGK55093.1 hypothetical protein B1NLA3E_16745 [Bacillus sp. 1NLA3E]
MESLLFAGVSLLILFPILYFLPIGFTVKGKVLLAVASFLIGLFGLVASIVFSLWQTGWILLMFVGTSSYFINKKGGKWLYLPEVNQDPFFKEEQQPDSPAEEVVINDNYSYIASSDKKVELDKRDKKFAKKQKTLKSKDSEVIQHTAENQIAAAVIQKPVPTTLLEKLVFQNDHELSLIRKPDEDNLDDTEIEEIVLDEEDRIKLKKPVGIEDLTSAKGNLALVENVELDVLDIDFVEPELQEPGFADTSDSKLEDYRIDSIEMLEPKSSISETTDDLVFDLETLLEEGDEPLEQQEPSSIIIEQSHDYMSEIEKMIESDELGSDSIQPLEEIAIQTPQTDDSLEVISNPKAPKEEISEDAPAPSNDFEVEIEELSLEDLIKEINGNVVQEQKAVKEPEYELEEMVFANQRIQRTTTNQTPKEQVLIEKR